jgi:heme/copper-type cytochrome/quinol oxidase subunit 1
MKAIKTIEMFLAAAYTLISAILTAIKFIKQIGKLKAEGK